MHGRIMHHTFISSVLADISSSSVFRLAEFRPERHPVVRTEWFTHAEDVLEMDLRIFWGWGHFWLKLRGLIEGSEFGFKARIELSLRFVLLG